MDVIAVLMGAVVAPVGMAVGTSWNLSAENIVTIATFSTFGGRFVLDLLLGRSSLDSLLHRTLFTLVGSAFWSIVVILFGAPVTVLLVRTWLWALFVSLLTFWDLFGAFSTDSARMDAIRRVFYQERPRTDSEIHLWAKIYGICIGAWFGAFPIPLDWDEPWQAWPLTVFYGALIGWILLGNVAGPSVLRVIYGNRRTS